MDETQTTTTPSWFDDLAALREEIGSLVKHGQNPAYKQGGKAMKYTLLDDIHQYLPVFFRHNFQVYHRLSDYTLITSLVHRSGWAEESRFPIPKEAHEGGKVNLGTYNKPNNVWQEIVRVPMSAQDIKGAATYGQRTNLLALLALPQEDDDGNIASHVTTDTTDTTSNEQTPESDLPW